MNVELLRKAAAMPVIMHNWFNKTECGTVGCIAGNICLAAGENPPEEYVPIRAAQLADLHNHDLFYVEGGGWPQEYIDEYEELRHEAGKLDSKFVAPSDLISRVVEDYIETEGWT